MEQREALCAMALSHIGMFRATEILRLYRHAGSAAAVIDNRHDLRVILPDASPRLCEALEGIEPVLARAEEELSWAADHGVKPLGIDDSDYPCRLRECEDAPLVVYYRGSADLNPRRVINIVGTRHCTAYGEDVIRRFLSDLKTLCPDTLVVSGLAYGVDIHAHRYALRNGMDTVGVMAHGMDTLYPPAHRETANEMVGHGGLLTEYMTRSRIDKQNFVRRNRIVAGMSDACILIESANKGGGLITAGIAAGYGREVFAVPGRIGDAYSEGCNNLIRDNGAALLTSAEAFVKAMGWESDASLVKARADGIERTLFPDMSDDERRVADVLSQTNDLQVNVLSVKSGLPVSRLSALLFEMEMKGIVKAFAGGMYHLIK